MNDTMPKKPTISTRLLIGSVVKNTLADDHAIVRGTIRKILEKTQDIQVVGEAANGREALKLVSELDPHVLLLDMRMPELDGVAVIQNLAGQESAVKVLVLRVPIMSIITSRGRWSMAPPATSPRTRIRKPSLRR